MIRVLTEDPTATLRSLAEAGKQRSFGKRTVQPKSLNQRRYVEAIEKNDMVFGVGPAGTGKTYLAVAMAISALAGTCRSWLRHFTISVFAPRSNPANWYSDRLSGTGVTAPSIVDCDGTSV